MNLQGYSKGLGKKERAKRANNLCVLVCVLIPRGVEMQHCYKENDLC